MSLQDLFILCNEKFTLKTTLMVFYRVLERIEHMHKLNVIHRDIKTDNVMLGIGDDSTSMYLIDFGLSRSIIDERTGLHIPFIKKK